MQFIESDGISLHIASDITASYKYSYDYLYL